MYSNEAERANQDIYDDFKLRGTLWSPWFMGLRLESIYANHRLSACFAITT